MVIYVGQNSSGFCLPKIKSDNTSLKPLLYTVLYVMLTGAVTLMLRKDTIMIHFLFICRHPEDVQLEEKVHPDMKPS